MSHGWWVFTWITLIVGTLLFFATAFAFFEEYAFRTGGLTLSAFMWEATLAFPLFPFLLGFFAGGLMFGLSVHFWWHWLPPGASNVG